MWDVLVPSISDVHYVVVCSTGIHNHAPPPPDKPSPEIMTDVATLVQAMHQPDLTTCMQLFR